jgi:hypothetical protein
MKAIQQVLSIMDRRSKLLGMENNNVSIHMDLSTNLSEPIRVSMVGEDGATPTSTFSPENEARELLELMAKSGVLPEEDVNQMLGKPKLSLVDDKDIVDAEIVDPPLDDEESE